MAFKANDGIKPFDAYGYWRTGSCSPSSPNSRLKLACQASISRNQPWASWWSWAIEARTCSSPIASSAQLATLVPHASRIFLGLPGAVYRAHTGLFIALVAAALFAFLLWRTTLGYEIRAVGQSQRAARYAGISVRRTLIVTMLIAGAFAGLAGAVQIAGVDHNLTDQYFTDTTGFDAIAVALLGFNSAVGIILSAILFGALHAGGSVMQSDAGVSGSLVYVLQALILFSIAANFLRSVKLRLPALGRGPTSPGAEAPAAAVTEAADTGLAADDKGTA